VTRNEFRSDLYYRLNVFPITLPPLRTRQEDIPELVTHFVEIFGQRMGKKVDYISSQTMEAFTSYSWPGNIRELQNLIERAVILANDRVLPNPLPATEPTIAPFVVASVVKNSESTTPKTFRDSARDLILQTLDASGWVVGGSKGAATKLGLKRTTLIDKMKKLGIQRPAGRAGSPDANRFRQDWRPLRQPRRRKSSGQGEVPQVDSLSGQQRTRSISERWMPEDQGSDIREEGRLEQ
jgi:transcriptional regulator with GAF, ATPase, and Fis domain